MKKNLTLKDLGWALLNRVLIIVIVTVVGAGAGYGISTFLMTPYYSSRVSLIVSSTSGDASPDASSNTLNEITTQEQSSAATLLNTYAVVIRSDAICGEVSRRIAKQELDYSSSEIRSMITITQVDETAVMRIKVDCENADHACVIANTISDTATDMLNNYVPGGSITPLDSAQVATVPTGPNVLLYTGLLAVVFGGICVLIILLVYVFDNKIKTEEDLRSICTIPVVGIIPHVEQ